VKASIFDPKSHTSTEQPFEVSNLNQAAAFLASNILRYVETRPGSDKPTFIFDDPYGIGSDLRERYVRGVFPPINPKLHMDARAYLVEQMNRVTKAEAKDAAV
jgi:hypothetical protein